MQAVEAAVKDAEELLNGREWEFDTQSNHLDR